MRDVMENVYKSFKKLIIIFIIIVTGFNVYYLATYKVPPPSFYSLGITSDSVMAKFEELGFNFNSSGSVYKQLFTIGLSSDKNAVIHLIGPKEDLVNIKIVIRLSKQFSKSKLKLLRSYLEDMISLVYPNWIMGDKWLEENALDLSGSGRRTKKLNDIKLTLVISEKNMTMGLAFGDWDKLPKYDSKDKLWKHHD
jgi:hypothetical protein